MTEDEVHAGFKAANEQYRSAAREMESLNRLKDVPHPSLRRRYLICAGPLGISSKTQRPLLPIPQDYQS
jgi:hypothetical protein